MNKPIVIFILTGLIVLSCKKDKDEPLAHPVYHTFEGHIGTNDNSTIVSSDNNLIICGNLNNNISILKISKTGRLIWRNDFNAGNMSSSSGIMETNSHDLFIVGETFRNYSRTMKDVLLIKANNMGDTIWTKTYGGINSEYGANIIQTSDGNVMLSGKTESFGAGSVGDIYLIKVSTNGDILWSKSYPDPNQEEPFHLLETKNGEILVTGTDENVEADPRELYLLKVDVNGEKLWNKTIGSVSWNWGYSTIELPDGDLLTCGQLTSKEGYSQVLVVKTSNTGNPIWQKEYGEAYLSEKGNSLKHNSDGTFTISGTSYDVNTGKNDIVLLKIDANGNQIWFKSFGYSISDEWGINLCKDTNEDNIITGDYSDYIIMTKLDSAGNFK
jgi:hypothetical protein